MFKMGISSLTRSLRFNSLKKSLMSSIGLRFLSVCQVRQKSGEGYIIVVRCCSVISHFPVFHPRENYMHHGPGPGLAGKSPWSSRVRRTAGPAAGISFALTGERKEDFLNGRSMVGRGTLGTFLEPQFWYQSKICLDQVVWRCSK
jgi:hypothetical protein